MKKQLLVLAMVALGTSMTVSAQSVPGSAPRPISCTDDPLHPIAGRPYTYTASSTQAGNWTFWATKDPNFIVTDATSGVTTNNLGSRLLTTPVAPATTPDLIATSANYATAAATDNVQITWSDAILSGTGTGPGQTPTFIAALKDGTCVNNFNAWQLLPINAFTVDILNLENTSKAPIGTGQAVYTATEGQCFDAVRSAKWVTDKIEYNFGKNVLYFEVVAANFTNSWTPTFTLTGLNAAQTAVIEWDYTNAFTAPKTVTSGTAGADKVVTTETNTANGVSIFVRVTVSNNTFEGLAATNISLAVDGQNSVGLWDVVNATCTATTAADQADLAMQTLDPRPNVTPVAPSAPFVPGNQTN